MKISQTQITGCFEISSPIFDDLRGRFVKTFNYDVFKDGGLATNFREEYYTVSHKGVLRGLHFQTPPMDHEKMVYCLAGEVLDAVVDLRMGSPTYGKFETFKLSSEKGNSIYIPTGLAHGFYVLSEQAILQYKVTTVYSPENDTGILWESVGIPWPDINPIISDRDKNFVALDEFVSPFKFTRDVNV